jgi:phospholipid/cholesterol/gamma-HCH transport system substrate-binding protein
MKDTRKTEIRVGVTVLAGLIILLWIFGWAKNFKLTPSENTVRVKFNNTAGLEVGDPVTVNGVRKGFVEGILIEGESVLVIMKVDNKISLKEDASFAVSMLDLMGGKRIEINPGISANELNYTETHSGTFYADIPLVMSMLGSFQQDLSSTISDMQITLTSLNDYLGDKKLNEDIKSSMSNLSEATKKLNILIDENRNSLKQLTSNAVELTDEAKNFILENKENLSASVTGLRELLKNTDELVNRLNKLTDEITNRQNTLGKLIYDEKIYEDLIQSLKQLNELTQLMIEQLKDDGLKVDVKLF